MQKKKKKNKESRRCEALEIQLNNISMLFEARDISKSEEK